MFTPNGQLFVDNNTGKLKFKINKMKFSGDTLREAINEYKIKVLGNTTPTDLRTPFGKVTVWDTHLPSKNTLAFLPTET